MEKELCTMNIPSSPALVAEFRSHLRQVIQDLERDLPRVENPELRATLKEMYKGHTTLLAELDRRYPETADDAAT